jgi:OmcA/MtrC family decaheme c-type cytochrome
LVDVKNCNKCHDALGPTFHGGQYGGNIVLCRSCHVPTAGGAHLDTQSRSIDSYVHAIHSFQAFDAGSIQFTIPAKAATATTPAVPAMFDPVAAKRYQSYIEHTYPRFTTKACESCHLPGTYEVPDQSQTIPGLQSASATLKYGWFGLDATGKLVAAKDRGISGVPAGIVPSYATGPASRACGGCHRARLVNDDDLNGLLSFEQHTNMGGYMVDTSQTSTTYTTVTAYLYGVINRIMSLF